LKGEKFDLVVQKATELGVVKVTPLITRYADIHYAIKATRQSASLAGSESHSKQRTVWQGVCTGNQFAGVVRGRIGR
jgi:hypothetical protein